MSKVEYKGIQLEIAYINKKMNRALELLQNGLHNAERNLDSIPPAARLHYGNDLVIAQ